MFGTVSPNIYTTEGQEEVQLNQNVLHETHSPVWKAQWPSSYRSTKKQKANGHRAPKLSYFQNKSFFQLFPIL